MEQHYSGRSSRDDNKFRTPFDIEIVDIEIERPAGGCGRYERLKCEAEQKGGDHRGGPSCQGEVCGYNNAF